MSAITYSKFYVDGTWQNPTSSDTVTVTSPTTELPIGSVPAATTDDMDRAVAAARAAFDAAGGWAEWEPSRRHEVLDRFAAELDARAAETSRRVSLQNGMPIWLAEQFEGGFPSVLIRYYSQMAVDTPAVETRPGMLGGPPW